MQKSESEVAQSCLTLSDPMDYSPPGPPSMGFSRQEYWSGVPLPSPLTAARHIILVTAWAEDVYKISRWKMEYGSPWCFEIPRRIWWFNKTEMGCSVVKQCACQCRRCGFNPWVGKIHWRRNWQPTPIFLPGKSHGQRGLVGYSPWGSKEVGHNFFGLNDRDSQVYL